LKRVSVDIIISEQKFDFLWINPLIKAFVYKRSQNFVLDEFLLFWKSLILN